MKMTLEEAIKHTKDIMKDTSECTDCRMEHKQLLEWLVKLSQYEALEQRAKNLFGESWDLESCVEQLRQWYQAQKISDKC